MLDIVGDGLASDIAWMIVRVGLEDSLMDTLVGGAGWQFRRHCERALWA